MKGTWHLAGVVFLATAATVVGQVYQSQSGRALDANYGVGQGRVNSIRGANRAPRGNLVVTGQVSGGYHFRAAVGYVGANQFRTELPSAGLDNFIRGSTGLDRIGSGSLYGPGAYLSPSRTVLGAGSIVGRENAPGTSVPRAAYVRSPQAQQLYESAVERYKPILPNLAEAHRVNPLIRPLQPLPGQSGVAAGAEGVGPVEVGPVRPAASLLFGALRRQDQYRLAAELAGEGATEPPGRLGGPTDARIRPMPSQPEEAPAPTESPATPPAPKPPAAEAMPEPGQDVLLDVLMELQKMRQEEEARMGSRLPPGPQPAAPSEPAEGAQQPGPDRKEQQKQAVERIRDQLILRRLAGKSRDMFNLHVSRAEKALSKGKFYEAAGHFEIAIVLNRTNPLAHLGRGLALFAANEPLTSSFHIRDAMKLFPPLMGTAVDLDGILGKEVVAAGIERLERRLAEGEESSAPARLFLAAFMRSAMGQTQRAATHARRLRETSKDEIHRAYADFLLRSSPGQDQPTTKPAS